MDLFAGRLKSIRKQHKISQSTLSNLVGVSQNQISKYEKGIDTPNAAVMLKLTEALKVSAEYLMGIVNHVDLEECYRYMSERRKALFKQPEGEFTYRYYLDGAVHTSKIKYIFGVFTSDDDLPKRQKNSTRQDHPVYTKIQPMLYVDEIEGNFLKEILQSENEFAFGAFDGFLNDSLSLGSCYFTETGDRDPTLKLIIKRSGSVPGSNELPMGSPKYCMLAAEHGFLPREYAIDLIESTFLDFYLQLATKDKIQYLNRL